VFVSVITIYWRGGNYAFPFQKVIQPKEFSVITEKQENPYSFLASETGIPTDAVLQSTTIYAQDENECFVTRFYDVGAPDLARMNSHFSLSKRILVTDPARIEAHYHSLHDGKVAVARFDAVATFLRREKPGCGAIK